MGLGEIRLLGEWAGREGRRRGRGRGPDDRKGGGMREVRKGSERRGGEVGVLPDLSADLDTRGFHRGGRAHWRYISKSTTFINNSPKHRIEDLSRNLNPLKPRRPRQPRKHIMITNTPLPTPIPSSPRARRKHGWKRRPETHPPQRRQLEFGEDGGRVDRAERNGEGLACGGVRC